jgi:hypothetical protein
MRRNSSARNRRLERPSKNSDGVPSNSDMEKLGRTAAGELGRRALVNARPFCERQRNASDFVRGEGIGSCMCKYSDVPRAQLVEREDCTS